MEDCLDNHYQFLFFNLTKCQYEPRTIEEGCCNTFVQDYFICFGLVLFILSCLFLCFCFIRVCCYMMLPPTRPSASASVHVITSSPIPLQCHNYSSVRPEPPPPSYSSLSLSSVQQSTLSCSPPTYSSICLNNTNTNSEDEDGNFHSLPPPYISLIQV